MKNYFHIGIVGTGVSAIEHIKTIKKIKNLTVTSVHGSSTRSLTKIRKKFKNINTYT